MMTVDTFVGPSQIEGVGIFAAQDIAKGAVIWRYDRRFDRVIKRSDIHPGDRVLQNYLDKYSYPHHDNPELLVIEIDNGRFMNHAEFPNTDFTGQIKGFALYDIPAGEELTCNYAEFEPAFTLLPSRVSEFHPDRGADWVMRQA